MNRRSANGAEGERGQALVIFALALVAIIGMCGLVLDAGSASVQRRDQQNVADTAALAGANDYLVNGSDAAAVARGRTIAAQNGYTHGTDGVTVDVTVTRNTPATRVRVVISKPHQNGFAGIVGQPSWNVSATATAETGFPNTADGPAPFIFSIDAFTPDGTAKYTADRDFVTANGDVPVSATDFSWTNYATGNVDANDVRQIIDGSLVLNKTIDFGTYIGQHNQGNLTDMYGYANMHLRGKDVPVPIVDHAGNFMGWAMFRFASASGGNDKVIRGHFLSGFASGKLGVGPCSPRPCSGTPGLLGTYVLKLVD